MEDQLSNIISLEFRAKVESFKAFLINIKDEFDSFDRKHADQAAKIDFVLSKKDEIFTQFDAFFRDIWPYIESLDKKAIRVYQDYYQSILGSPLLEAEINKYIKEKPLGYPGDFVMMNYIYDYHKNFLGASSLEILINCYTTNIPISCSNIKRKEYFKQKLVEILESKEAPRIASIGCGSARELIELVEAGAIKKPLLFSCVDFEKKALYHIKDSLAKIDQSKKETLVVKYHHVDMRFLSQENELVDKLGQHDFVYASGLFDYLGKFLAKKVMLALFNLVNNSGLLIVVNAGVKDSHFRSYYEMLGAWKFAHRLEEEIIEWAQELKGASSVEFEKFSFPMNYLFLAIKKAKI
ncbi:MAG: hypothetical protein ABIH69_01300 [bacterium]|nr:hypothetical protein [Candidatus Margulisiibacteriota bacterium]